jgi:long-chain acyl-CoA synthetase
MFAYYKQTHKKRTMTSNKKQTTNQNTHGSFLKLIENNIRNNWDIEALTDYKGETLKYKDVALSIARLHILFEYAGVKKGDKIALCGRNSSNWGVVFLATLTYGAISVPILHEFKADNIHNIVKHSDSVLLFVGENVWENLDESAMPQLKGIVSISDFSILVSNNSNLTKAHENINKLMGKKYPKSFDKSQIKYHRDNPEEIAYISYTSGTTSFSKGVMIPYRSLWSNMMFAHANMPLKPGDCHVCMLPLAHAFGLLFSFLFEFTRGCHTYFLTRTPSPKIIFSAYAEVKPNLIITVPLIVEKVVKKAILPKLNTNPMKMAMHVPLLKEYILQGVRRKLLELFGGNVLELVIGGASINEEVETLLQRINFPYTIGYGMTECGPLICYASSATFKKGSCGRPVDRMKVKIDSDDPCNTVGEILVRGDNVMKGYYKNEAATKEALRPDGWMYTGDLGVMDENNNLTIRGRSKNMLLGPNGQNIYPEEIEDKLNSLPFVAESIVTHQEGKLVALVHPDYNETMAQGLNTSDIVRLMDENRQTLNNMIPKYSQIASIKIYPEEFEKTPKRSIKRYLYT